MEMADGIGRSKDGVPQWSGEAASFQDYEDQCLQWEQSIAYNKRYLAAPRLVGELSGTARKYVAGKRPDWVSFPGGVSHLMQHLRRRCCAHEICVPAAGMPPAEHENAKTRKRENAKHRNGKKRKRENAKTRKRRKRRKHNPFRSTLNTNVITDVGMCKVCTPAVHSVYFEHKLYHSFGHV